MPATHFPVPPVCTAAWTDEDWARWAERHGVDRSGPDYGPNGVYEPSTMEGVCGTWEKTGKTNAKGEALYRLRGS